MEYETHGYEDWTGGTLVLEVEHELPKEPRHRADPDGAPYGAEMVTDPIDSPSYKGLAA